ncbi:hypothetical protein GCM10009720_17840 [Yaniella flava]|uniref:Gram-positive cocci surface proteins LPxTG domain-containing protein n=2 Tax=Yaniella flava TaxID=287930 RepID=A0ABP5G094_9MICC
MSHAANNEAWNTPGTANEAFADEDDSNEPDPEPTEPTEPGEVCEADFTLISEIQGEGQGTDMTDETVTVQGVVTGDFTNNAGSQNGFYVQEEAADYDGNPATSEGIFVYDPNGTAPEPGTLVAVEGQVGEHYELTQIGADEIAECGTAELPEPLDVTFPLDDSDFPAMESMRVNVEEAVVLETYQFGRYGETVVGPERQFQPTAMHSPGSAEAQELYESNMANRIKIDDGRSDQNPDPAMHLNGEEFTAENFFRGGDTFRNITGVLDYRFEEWKIQQTGGAEHVPNLERPDVPEVGGDVTVGAFNVLNYFTTMGSRGANNAEEFQRQEDKIVSAIADMDADVLGLMEIENNDDEAVTTLVNALNERVGEDRYSAIETGQLGTDEITTAIIFQADAVEPVGDFYVLDATVDDRFDTARHRPALAQTFAPVANADSTDDQLDEFTMVTNHLKSKGSECGSEGDNTHLVGSCDAERTAAAEALVDWVDTQDMPNPVITGDLNAYDQEAPIAALQDGGYTDLRAHFDGAEAYSYVFDGQLGYLDYAMAGEELMPFITGATSWHANSDEVPIFDYTTEFKQPAHQEIYEPGPYRASDHDPVLFGLSLTAGDTEEPTDPEEPTNPEEPSDPTDPTDPSDPEAPLDPSLSIEPQRIAVEDFIGSDEDAERGVLLRVDGLEPGEQVQFTVTPRSGNVQPYEHTAVANDDGVAQWHVAGLNSAEIDAYIGAYDVVASYGDEAENTLNGSFEVYSNNPAPETETPETDSPGEQPPAELGESAYNGDLANTGANSVLLFASVAVLLLVVGGSALFMSRRHH